MTTIFDKPPLTAAQRAARAAAKERLLVRRAAALAGIDPPAWAARIWGTKPWSLPHLRGVQAKYHFPPDYAPSAPELTQVRKLYREQNLTMPKWAEPQKRMKRV